MSARSLAREMLDLALPRRCGGCDRPGVGLCAECAAYLRALRSARAYRTAPSPCPDRFPATWALAAYDGPLAAMLRCYKDDDRLDLREPLAALLRDSLAEAVASGGGDGGPMMIVAVPSSARARRARGRDPLADLVRSALRGQRRLVHARLLRAGRVRDQAALTARERAANIGGSMRLRRPVDLGGVRCIVVDDIVTTGATLGEAARVLRAAGAGDVTASVIAATARTGGGRP